MTVQLSSLRVTADFDASGYTRGSTQKVDADARMTESDRRRVAALAAQDAATEKSAGTLARLSKSYVDGYSAGARFEQAIRNLQKGFETGKVPLERVSDILEGLHAKFGLTANAAEIAAKGNVDLANAVARTNAELTQSQLDISKIAEATAVYTQNLDALRAKYDAVFAAQLRYKQELADINAAERQGAFAENPSIANTARLQAAETYGRSTAPQASQLSDSDSHMAAYRANLAALAKEETALRD